jgi:hypothetical protein
MDSIFTASVHLTYADLRYFNLYHDLKKGSKYRLSVMFLAAITVMLLGTLAYQLYQKFNIYYIMYIVIVLLLPFGRYAVLAARTKKADRSYQESGSRSRYDFTETGIVREKTDTNGTKRSEFQYDSYIRIVQTINAFYLYITENEVNIIPLGSITKGTPAELAKFLEEKLGKSFVVSTQKYFKF